MGYFTIKSLIRSYRFPRIFVMIFDILASSMFQNVLKSYGWWDLICDFKLIYLLRYILLLEELDTKRLFRGLPRLFRGFTTPVFVTSCHAWLFYPRGLCVHACFRDFVSRLVMLPSWNVCPRLLSWLRVTPVIRLCQFLYGKQVFHNKEFSCWF